MRWTAWIAGPVPVVVLDRSGGPAAALTASSAAPAAPAVGLSASATATVPVVVGVPAAPEPVRPEPEAALGFWPDSAWARASWAASRSAWALRRAWSSEFVSRVARGWPTVTGSPTATATDATVPATGKPTAARLTGSIVATPASSASSERTAAVAVR